MDICFTQTFIKYYFHNIFQSEFLIFLQKKTIRKIKTQLPIERRTCSNVETNFSMFHICIGILITNQHSVKQIENV